VLLNRPSRRIIDIDLAYVGFEVPDVYLVGYGLDHHERYRNLPYIARFEQPH
jgi:hypoxanthine phosphoribosyltransferase